MAEGMGENVRRRLKGEMNEMGAHLVRADGGGEKTSGKKR
jgi:hypothetical protein